MNKFYVTQTCDRDKLRKMAHDHEPCEWHEHAQHEPCVVGLCGVLDDGHLPFMVYKEPA